MACLIFGNLGASSIGYVEKFAIAEDRAEALKELIPGTRDYYYFHALHAQNRDDRQELNRILGLWIKRHGHTSRVKEVRNRQALLDFEQNPNGTITHLRNELGLNFNHSRFVEGQKPRHPTTLDPVAISSNTFLDSAFRQYKNLQGVSDRGLDNLKHGAP
jgi:hypothetical protein